jgi:hypothetical protein
MPRSSPEDSTSSCTAWKADEYDEARAAIEATAVIRRLVVTGEDRKQNFVLLFGKR